MENIPVIMVRENLENLPYFPLPEGYGFRTFKKGDEHIWAGIETAAGEFKDLESALEHFKKEFGPYTDEMEKRCFFIHNENGREIGTATAWYNHNFNGKEYGRLHWVAIHPDFQGKGLARPLIGIALYRLAEFHNRAYLTTQTKSFKAIKVYLDYGFVPLKGTPRFEEAWGLLASILMKNRKENVQCIMKDNEELRM